MHLRMSRINRPPLMGRKPVWKQKKVSTIMLCTLTGKIWTFLFQFCLPLI